MLRFERHWWAALDYEFTPHGFCDDETYDRLPPLPEHLLAGDFRWLIADAAGPDAYYMEACPVAKNRLYQIDHRLARSGLALPPAFGTFISSAELQRRVPSATSNGWEMSELAPSPVEEHGFVLRFMHDQQGCWFFYLYLAADGSCPVIGSVDLFTPEDDDECPALTPAEFMESAKWLAPDFEQFLYRYWVDNVVWYHRRRPSSELPPPAQEYVKLLATPGLPALGLRPKPLKWSSDHPDQLELW